MLMRMPRPTGARTTWCKRGESERRGERGGERGGESERRGERGGGCEEKGSMYLCVLGERVASGKEG